MSTANVPGQDAFNQFWGDVWSRMGAAGAPTAAQFSPELMNGFRKAFFEAMASAADQVMRSDQFRASLKQAMDGTIAWQQMMNQYLQGGLQAAQVPTRGDADQIVQLVRGLEQRLGEKLDSISQRVDRLESHSSKPATAKASKN